MFSIQHVFEQMEPSTDYLFVEREQWLQKFVLNPRFHGVEFARGIIFFGPSGNGKTICVHAFAKRIGIPVLSITCQETVQAYSNNVSERIHSIFIEANESGSLLHFDGIEALLGRPNPNKVSLLNPFKSFMQQYYNVIVIGTTNDLNLLDPTVRCTGQFSHEIFFDYPQLDERIGFLTFLCRNHPEVNVNSLAEKTEKYTMGQLKHAVDVAVINQLSDSEKFLQDYHFDLIPPKINTCSFLENWDQSTNLMLTGRNTHKHIAYLMDHLHSSHQVTEFPVLQQQYKYYFVKHINYYNQRDVVEFLEWCSLNQKVVVATSFFQYLTEPIAFFFELSTDC
jgi:SpoVK/Ycf46/Vps4 family AAA+-type ATPase